jgi:hypothetical protein
MLLFFYFTNEIFSVTREDLLTEEDICTYWKYVDADRKEIQSFVIHDVFQLDVASNSKNTVDGVWVRKFLWKSYCH